MVQIFGKLRKKGVIGVIGAVAGRLEARLGRVRRRAEALRALKQADHLAVFANDGGMTLKLPETSAWRGLWGTDPGLQTSFDFLNSPNSEALLRATIYRLYQAGHVDAGKSIIDIGCWCADNTLVWATYLHDTGQVYAIDPSADNLTYAKAIAAHHGISNINWVQAVCAETSGLTLGFLGSVDHTHFHDATEADAQKMSSRTLDDIVGPDNLGSIGFLHVDVEGFEERVLRGAERIIQASMPVIAFEHHLCDERWMSVCDGLAEKGYRIFMVNEIIPECRSDCRNFIAFPPGFDIPDKVVGPALPEPPHQFTPATLGPHLLAVPSIRDSARQMSQGSDGLDKT